MNIGTIAHNMFRQMRVDGFAQTIRSLAYRANMHFQERRLGIQTEAVIELSELGIDNPECKYYSPTEYNSFAKMMRAAKINPCEHVFLDFGAGLGRAMILAAAYPFKRILGVELSGELVARAKENFRRCKDKLRCRNLEIEAGDATTYRIPDDVTVAYFYNPFFGDVLSRALVNLRTSLENFPRDIIVICNLPLNSTFESQIALQNWLYLQQRVAVSDGRLCLIFSSTPSAEKRANR